MRSCPQGTGRIRNSGTSCGIGGGGVGERNEKEEGQRKRFAERREGMTHSGLLAFPSQVHIRSFLLRRGKRSLHFLPTLLLPLLPSPTLALSSVFQRRWRLAKRPRSSCDRNSLLIPSVTCRDMDILSCLRAWRRGLSVLSKGQRGGPDLFV